MYFAVPGYTNIEQIYEGDNNVILRAKKLSNEETYILKVTKDEQPKPDLVANLVHEYNILQDVDSPFTSKTFGLEYAGTRLMLVLEDFEATSLDFLIAKRQIDLGSFLLLAVKITEALGDIHRKGVVHKGIQPSNILVGVHEEGVKIIDFAYAMKSQRELSESIDLKTDPRSASFISLEMFEGVNRVVDKRADIYSLGVTLYEMLTSQLPFISKENALQTRLSSEPIPPHEINENIPKVVSDIILKCFKNEAQDRYHDASGIAHDLKICLEKFDAEGVIDFFEPGQKDVYADFLLPSKLYGRENEIYRINEQFASACEQKGEVVFIEGPLGSGKTTLVNELQMEVALRDGIFVVGKCDVTGKNIPFDPLIQISQKMLKQIMKKENKEIDEWKKRISDALGSNGGVLTNIIPELEDFLGPQPQVVKLDLQNSRNRLLLIFMNFIESLFTPENPLVLFLDDFEWVDESTLKFVEFFLEGQVPQGCLVVLAFNGAQLKKGAQLVSVLAELQKNQPDSITIKLLPLEVIAIREIICEICHVSPEEAEPLAKIIKKKTDGTPLYIVQMLTHMYEEKAIFYHNETQSWILDPNRVKQFPDSKQLEILIKQKLKKIPKSCLETLKKAAIIGENFQLDLLSSLSKMNPYSTLIDLQVPIGKEILYVDKATGELNIFELVSAGEKIDSSFVFTHKIFRDVVSQMVSEREKNEIVLTIGQTFLNRVSGKKVTSKVFEAILFLSQGFPSLDSSEDKIRVAKLNLIAGEEAIKRISYHQAGEFFETAVQFLEKGFWESHFDLCSSLFENLVLCQILAGNHEQAEDSFHILLSHIDDVHFKSRLYVNKIKIYANEGDFQSAVNTMKEGLRLYNIESDYQPGSISAIVQQIRMYINISFRHIDRQKINSEQDRSDGYWITAMYSETIYPIFKLGLSEIFSSRIINSFFKYGAYDHSAISLSSVAAINCSYFIQDYKTSKQLINYLPKLRKKYPNSISCLYAEISYYSVLFPFYEPIKDIFTHLDRLLDESLKIGMTGYATTCLTAKLYFLILSGETFDQVYPRMESIFQQIKKYKKKLAITDSEILLEHCLELQGLQAEIPERVSEKISLDNPDIKKFSVHYYAACKMSAIYLQESFLEAVDLMRKTDPYYKNAPSHPLWHYYHYYRSLSLAKLCEDPNYKNQFFGILKEDLNWLEKLSLQAPFNFKQKYSILAGEIARVEGNMKEALDFFKKGVREAKENGNLRDQALGYELLGRLYFEIDNRIYSEIFIQWAFKTYSHWGAIGKLKKLKEEFQDFTFYEDITTTATGTLTTTSSSGITDENRMTTTQDTAQIGTTKTSTSMREAFDVSAIIRASQVLAGEIVFDNLLTKLLHIVIVNAGADKAILVLVQQDKFYVQAEMLLGQDTATILKSVPLEEKANSLSIPIVLYSARSKKEVLLEDAVHNSNFLQDAYIQNNEVQSLLCLPLIYQGKLSGILYLENRLTKGAFTEGHLRLLSLLSVQIAISIENAQFYAKLEEKVEERTRELRETQDQLVQQEKIASLGFLTSGIAHEISNPLNFVINNSQIAVEYLKMLEEEVEEHKKQGDHIPEDVEDTIAVLRTSLKTMQDNSLRAGGIVKKMLEHSTIKADEFVKTNLHSLIDSAIQTSIQHMRDSEPSFNIQVETNYDTKVGKADIAPQEISRVISNLLDNSFYTILEKKAEQGDNFTPKVKITTKNLGDKCEIRIQDNGKGILPEIEKKIFTPFVTTKPPGKGTGLALSLSYNIITLQHEGNLFFSTKEGQETEFVITLPLVRAKAFTM